MREQRKEQRKVTGLDVSELTRDHPKGMLNRPPHFGDDPGDIIPNRKKLSALGGLLYYSS
ncbi:MAG: hypothetical protein NXH94_19670 [Rhodobacteraceae bacterium]|uniref:hypothetical protein n=1 Tax=Marivita sp. TaxID=2003365 RepID=UPI003B5301E3|nr:hypothetical protein [Paracoccaceae bacterium]